MRDNFDRFYTPEQIACRCVQLTQSVLDMKKHIIIEPSYGTGSFIMAIHQSGVDCSIAYDINPVTNSSIDLSGTRTKAIVADFLSSSKQDIPTDAIFIGNPPFGKRATTASAFIRHCIELQASSIAFILPATFGKFSKQQVFPSDWRLILQKDLQRIAFKTCDEEDMEIPVIFQIWTHDDSAMPGINLRAIKIAQPEEYRFMPRGSIDADFCINGNSGRVRMPDNLTNSKAEHYIMATNRNAESIKKLIDTFRTINETSLYDRQSSVNGGNYWLSQNEINQAFMQYKHISDTADKQAKDRTQ